jgi:hypothetical protein
LYQFLPTLLELACLACTLRQAKVDLQSSIPQGQVGSRHTCDGGVLATDRGTRAKKGRCHDYRILAYFNQRWAAVMVRFT